MRSPRITLCISLVIISLMMMQIAVLYIQHRWYPQDWHILREKMQKEKKGVATAPICKCVDVYEMENDGFPKPTSES